MPFANVVFCILWFLYPVVYYILWFIVSFGLLYPLVYHVLCGHPTLTQRSPFPTSLEYPTWQETIVCQ
jgi:hypothetical protein